MFRMWCKIFKDNHMIRDTVIANDSNSVTRTGKVLDALDTACHEFDLAVPMWLESTIEDFRRHDKTRFYQDNFIEHIEFDFLEIHVIEED